MESNLRVNLGTGDAGREAELVAQLLAEGKLAFVGKAYEPNYVLAWSIGLTPYDIPEIVILLNEKDDTKGKTVLLNILDSMRSIPVEGLDYFLEHCCFDLGSVAASGVDEVIDKFVHERTSLPVYFPDGFRFLLYATPERRF